MSATSHNPAMEATMPTGKFALKAFNSFIGVTGVVAGLTILFLCARRVMEVGGSCADGGPYVSAQPCPKGVWLTPVSIFAGLIFLGWLVFWNMGLSGPKWALLGWPALFLSLGWNFWEFGLDPPGEGGSVAAGWIVCGVVFVLMGGLPLLGLWSKSARKATFWSDAEPGRIAGVIKKPTPRVTVQAVNKVVRQAAAATGTVPRQPRPEPSRPHNAPTTGDAATDMVEELQRLADLHRSGALTDEEFAIAKQRVLRAT